MKPILLLSLGLLTASFSLSSPASRTSTDYVIEAEDDDAGGRPASSAAYGLANSSVGNGTGGMVTSASYRLRAGYLGQVFEVASLSLTADSTFVSEGGSVTLGGGLMLDDASLLPLAPTAIAWSVLTGPVSGISAGGLASLGTVYQDTSASVRGAFGGFSDTLPLTVLNTNLDDYGTYAADGLDDAWQVQYFGFNNPQAAPTADASGTGQNNLFKYLAGLDPRDARSRFLTEARPSTAQPGAKEIVYGPLADGRVYVVEAISTLAGSVNTWEPIVNFTVTQQGDFATVTDLDAATFPRRMYRVRIAFGSGS